jgi:hypothetical protein
MPNSRSRIPNRELQEMERDTIQEPAECYYDQNERYEARECAKSGWTPAANGTTHRGGSNSRAHFRAALIRVQIAFASSPRPSFTL